MENLLPERRIAERTMIQTGAAVRHFSRWHAAAVIVALVGLAGSLYLSVGMGLKACPLCFYQRSFVMAIVAILVVGWPLDPRPSGLLCALALPLAAAGLGVALFHVYLELTGKLECPGGVLGVGSAPQQSLAVFAVLLVILVSGTLSERAEGPLGLRIICGATLLGAALSAASIWSAPPLPAAPTNPYAEPLTICRPPYVIK